MSIICLCQLLCPNVDTNHTIQYTATSNNTDQNMRNIGTISQQKYCINAVTQPLYHLCSYHDVLIYTLGWKRLMKKKLESDLRNIMRQP